MNESFSDTELVEFYDLINSGKEDLNFFLAKAPHSSTKVLDIGCGTGELAIELVKKGHEVVAIDPEPAMINCCRKKMEHERLHWEVGDLPSFASPSSSPNSPSYTDKPSSPNPSTSANQPSYKKAPDFGLITMTGHAFQYLLNDQVILGFFEYIHQLLAPDGYFLFESRNPTIRSWEKWDQHRDQFELPSGEPLVLDVEVVSYQKEVLEFQETYTIGQKKRVKKSSSRLRFAEYATLISLAQQAGLQILELWGDWQGNPFSPNESREMIFKLGRKP